MGHATTAISDALARLLGRESARFFREAVRAREGDVRGVHQTRVATRRLREMLAIIAVLPKADARGVRRTLRRLAGALGPVRELDVALAVWHEARARGPWPSVVARTLDRGAASDRVRHVTAMRRALDRHADARLARRLADLGEVLRHDHHHDSVLVAALAARVRRRCRAVASALESAGTAYVPIPLHDARLAAKKLRYVAELLARVADGPLGPAVARLKTTQDVLGRIHDLQIVQERIQASAATARDRRTVRALELADADLEFECREKHAKFVASVPALVDVTVRLGDAALAAIQPRPTRIPELAAGPGIQARRRRGGA